MKKLTIMIFVLAFALLNNVYGQDNKTVDITVSGDGPSKQEALQAALRNAIEQAFGTFISSKTQILNDELISDEIVSVSSGNIHGYKVISEVQSPDGFWSNTVRATVAVDKLTTFCESKGVVVEFKGSLFALNIKQQMLNEQNELQAIVNMRKVLKEILGQSFNYVISTSQPISHRGYWQIPVLIEGTLNNNFIDVSNYLLNTLKGLSCDQSEIDNYKALQKELYYIAYQPLGVKDKDASFFALRNRQSFEEIKCLIDDLKESFFNFSINNGVEVIDMQHLEAKQTEESSYTGSGNRIPQYYYKSENKSIEDISVISYKFRPLLTERDMFKPNESNFFQQHSYRYDRRIYPIRNDSSDRTRNNYVLFERYRKKYFNFIRNWDVLSNRSNEYIVISFNNLIISNSKGILSFNNVYNIDQIQQISEYKVIPNDK